MPRQPARRRAEIAKPEISLTLPPPEPEQRRWNLSDAGREKARFLVFMLAAVIFCATMPLREILFPWVRIVAAWREAFGG